MEFPWDFLVVLRSGYEFDWNLMGCNAVVLYTWGLIAIFGGTSTEGRLWNVDSSEGNLKECCLPILGISFDITPRGQKYSSVHVTD